MFPFHTSALRRLAAKMRVQIRTVIVLERIIRANPLHGTGVKLILERYRKGKGIERQRAFTFRGGASGRELFERRKNSVSVKSLQKQIRQRVVKNFVFPP